MALVAVGVTVAWAANTAPSGSGLLLSVKDSPRCVPVTVSGPVKHAELDRVNVPVTCPMFTEVWSTFSVTTAVRPAPSLALPVHVPVTAVNSCALQVPAVAPSAVQASFAFAALQFPLMAAWLSAIVPVREKVGSPVISSSVMVRLMVLVPEACPAAVTPPQPNPNGALPISLEVTIGSVSSKSCPANSSAGVPAVPVNVNSQLPCGSNGSVGVFVVDFAGEPQATVNAVANNNAKMQNGRKSDLTCRFFLGPGNRSVTERPQVVESRRSSVGRAADS